MRHPASAHALFRARYPRNLEIALGIALGIHLLAIFFYPPVTPAPPATAIEHFDPTVWYDVPEEIHVLPAPPEISTVGISAAWEEIEAVEDLPVDMPEMETGEDLFRNPVTPWQEPRQVFTAFDTEPRVLKTAKPVYPELAREAGAEGTVLVEVTVDRTGRVTEARVVGSDTVIALEKAAVDAAMKYLFSPALQRNVPVTVRTVLTFEFRLR